MAGRGGGVKGRIKTPRNPFPTRSVHSVSLARLNYFVLWRSIYRAPFMGHAPIKHQCTAMNKAPFHVTLGKQKPFFLNVLRRVDMCSDEGKWNKITKGMAGAGGGTIFVCIFPVCLGFFSPQYHEDCSCVESALKERLQNQMAANSTGLVSKSVKMLPQSHFILT